MSTAATASASASPTVSVPAAWAPCSVLAGTGTVTTFRSGDVGLSGVEFGTGATGVVLAPPVGETLCDWVVYATQLARLGYRVLAFDFAGTGASATPHSGGVSADADVTAAVQFTREIVVSRGDVAGFGILYGPSSVSIKTQIETFLKQHAPPR